MPCVSLGQKWEGLLLLCIKQLTLLLHYKMDEVILGIGKGIYIIVTPHFQYIHVISTAILCNIHTMQYSFTCSCMYIEIAIVAHN